MRKESAKTKVNRLLAKRELAIKSRKKLQKTTLELEDLCLKNKIGLKSYQVKLAKKRKQFTLPEKMRTLNEIFYITNNFVVCRCMRLMEEMDCSYMYRKEWMIMVDGLVTKVSAEVDIL